MVVGIPAVFLGLDDGHRFAEIFGAVRRKVVRSEDPSSHQWVKEFRNIEGWDGINTHLPVPVEAELHAPDRDTVGRQVSRFRAFEEDGFVHFLPTLPIMEPHRLDERIDEIVSRQKPGRAFHRFEQESHNTFSFTFEPALSFALLASRSARMTFWLTFPGAGVLSLGQAFFLVRRS